MLTYLIRRLLTSVFLLWGVVTLTFLLLQVAPGDPVDLMLDPSVPNEDATALRERFGLDAPWPEQYARWLGGVARGDLGISLRRQRPVADVLLEALPHTLRLTVLSLLVMYAVGIGLGLLAALRRGTRWDRWTTLGSLALYSAPVFWLSLMVQLVFSVKLGWLPTGGTGTVDPVATDMRTWAGVDLRHLVLPVSVLGLTSAAGVARYVRGSVLEVLGQEYIRTAHAKGLPARDVVTRHVLRNAAMPVVTLLGLHLPFLFGGAVVVETIFAWPGMGRVVVEAIFSRDYPVILATTMFSAGLVVLGSLLADLGYAWLDPRVRLS